jgi:branched-subunit amino acid transport protein
VEKLSGDSGHERRLSLATTMALGGGTVGGWILGLGAYLRVHHALFGRGVSAADAESMGMWIALATAATVPIAHLPLAAWLQRQVARTLPRMLAGFVGGMILGPLPAGLMAIMWSGGRFSALWTWEYLLATVWAALLGGGLTSAAVLFSRFGNEVP